MLKNICYSFISETDGIQNSLKNPEDMWRIPSYNLHYIPEQEPPAKSSRIGSYDISTDYAYFNIGSYLFIF